ncbi:alternate-type signal peptide domain-containing protein [Rhodococcus fascians]|nr:alternate-type signal peptide domain-containing protein [Rhodococcus fascians]MBY4236844.1 alternate-type signal peptide domain-containing protein [Rhodococcus fascians]MBY4252910.1 alternate-type signal peptide domain-containing protein [Rhodococcus fascians]MBY4268160.1 alternate-type signal peptide domain-containing protein [Rhodococcus fascians]
MNKATKGAVAAGAAAVLLLGGLGSLALWNDSEQLDGGTITSGDLSLTQDGEPVWSEISGDVNAARVIDPATFLIVPGDVVTYSAAFDIAASGDNLQADLSVDIADLVPGTGNAQLLSRIDTDIVATSGATVLPTDGETVRISSADQVVDLTVTFTFDENTPLQEAQNQSIDLEAFTLNLQQVREAVTP